MGPATADVSVESPTGLRGRGVGISLEQCDSRHDETRRAETAHHPVPVAESLLNGMERVPLGKPFNGPDLLPLHLNRKRGAGVHRAAIYDHRAGPTGSAIADAFLSGEVQPHPHGIEQGDTGLDLEVVAPTVDGERDRDFAWTDCPSGQPSLGLRLAANHTGRKTTDPDSLEKVPSTD
jgi:hypothetical protein